MRDMIRRTFYAVSASTAFFFAAMSTWLVFSTRGISTMDGIVLLMTAVAGLFGAVVHGLQAYEEHLGPLSIRPEDCVRSFGNIKPQPGHRPVSHGV